MCVGLPFIEARSFGNDALPLVSPPRQPALQAMADGLICRSEVTYQAPLIGE
jgi:hypothetical protein